MAHTQSIEAIILQTHNVGEADRFCILLSKEKGKIAARARGVRKLNTRFGGSVLPLSHISAEIRESSAGYMITDAKRIQEYGPANISSFVHAQQGVEILLHIVHDEQPLPEIFDVLLHFLSYCSTEKEPTSLPFTLQILHLLGMLPDRENMYRFGTYSSAQITYMESSVTGQWDTLTPLQNDEKKAFSHLCALLISEISSRPLNAGAVMKDMLMITK